MMVEAALVVPILCFVTLAMVQFGVVLNARISLGHIARSAGRYAGVKGGFATVTGINADDAIKNKTIAIAQGYGIPLTAANITLSPTQNTATQLNNRPRYSMLTMTINYNMSNRVFLPPNFFGIRIGNPGNTVTTNTVMVENVGAVETSSS